MNSVINGSFNIIKKVVGAASDHQSGESAIVLIISSEHSDSVAADLLDVNAGSVTELVRGWGTDSEQGSCAQQFRDSSELELRSDLDGHDFIFFEVVEHELRNGTSANNDIAAGISDGLDEFIRELLLALVVV